MPDSQQHDGPSLLPQPLSQPVPERIWLLDLGSGDIVWSVERDPDGEQVDAVEYVRVDALRSPEPSEGWMPIETAPKDGTLIDVWIEGEFPGRRTDVSWRTPTDSEWWVHGGDTIETTDPTWHDPFGPLGNIEAPTHWQPLPAPPSLSLLDR